MIDSLRESLDNGKPALPNFEHPPVVEVVCGISFKTLEKFLIPWIGELWAEFRKDFPLCQEHPPLAQFKEHSGAPGGIEIEIPRMPPAPRVWFHNLDESHLIQVQRDRFIHNWKKPNDQAQYPRYSKIQELFRDELARFKTFIVKNELGQVEPIQYELTYVNIFPIGEGWNDLSEIGKILPDCSWRGSGQRFLPTPESHTYQTRFSLPDNGGALHVNVQRATKLTNGQDVIRMDFSVRGFPGKHSEDTMHNWFEVAHRWIVLGFTDMTSSEIQSDQWGRIS